MPTPSPPTPSTTSSAPSTPSSRIAALQPANSAENDLAARERDRARPKVGAHESHSQKKSVGCNELWMGTVLLSRDPDLPLLWKLKCRAEAASMMRQATSAIRAPRRLQTERREIESGPEACDRGERIEHITTVLLNEGIADPETVMASTARRQEVIVTATPAADPPSEPAQPHSSLTLRS